jgi:hypothetical protein
MKYKLTTKQLIKEIQAREYLSFSKTIKNPYLIKFFYKKNIDKKVKNV